MNESDRVAELNATQNFLAGMIAGLFEKHQADGKSTSKPYHLEWHAWDSSVVLVFDESRNRYRFTVRYDGVGDDPMPSQPTGVTPPGEGEE